MSRYLLDTHALLWWLDGSSKLPGSQRRLLTKATTVTFVSAVSVWEIVTKVRIGRLKDRRNLADDLGGTVASHGFTELPITFAHAQRAGELPDPLRDPFDRILIAQSLLESLPIISADEAFDKYGVVRVWA
ncbi:MAG: type II toxin-antitoxin system VapC family toxin [Alphaproteobacteria bacterium]|nr:type II toxin-antitoxin system VapC family toxin [Alphaproteobacteria bacterium]